MTGAKTVPRWEVNLTKLTDHSGGLVAWPYAEPWVIDVGIRSVRLEERTFLELGRHPLSWRPSP